MPRIQTLDPTSGLPLEAFDALCDAHIIPEALGASNCTVRADRSFDNCFGTMNDAVMVNAVRNFVDGTIDVRLDLLEDPSRPSDVLTTMKTKMTLENKPGEPRRGKFVLGFPEGTSDTWRERYLGDGCALRVAINQHNPESMARSNLSMIHSALLSVCWQFGDGYGSTPVLAEFVGPFLRAGCRRNIDDGVLTVCTARHFAAYALNSILGSGLRTVATEFLKRSEHPVFAIQCDGLFALGAVLHYHKRFDQVAFLPAPDQDDASDYFELLTRLFRSKVEAKDITFATCTNDDDVTPLSEWFAHVRTLR